MKRANKILLSVIMLAGCMVSYNIVADQNDGVACQIGGGACHAVGRKFNLGDQVMIVQDGSDLKGRVATIIEDNEERIERHKKANNCPGHCIVYSLLMNDTQEFAECCQPYLRKMD